MEQHKHEMHDVQELNQTILRIDTEGTQLTGVLQSETHDREEADDELKDELDTLEATVNKYYGNLNARLQALEPKPPTSDHIRPA